MAAKTSQPRAQADEESRWRCTVPLEVSPYAQRKLRVIFRHSQNIYNACIREGRRRLKACRNHPAYAEATAIASEMREKDAEQKRLTSHMKRLPRRSSEAAELKAAKKRLAAEEKTLKAKRQQLYKEAGTAAEFSERELEKWVAKTFPKSQERLQVPAQVRNRLCRRAWKAIKKVAYDPKAKVPHFKSRRFPLESITSNNLQQISWDGNSVRISRVNLPCRYTDVDRYHDWLRARHGTKEITVCDIVRRASRHGWHFEAQFTCKGEPPRDKPLGSGRVGIDLGPSTIAVVSETWTALEELCGELTVLHNKLRRLQRQDDRQRRANNPDNYHPDGRAKKGRRKWVVSNRQRQTRNLIRDLHRREVAHRKSLHGRLINAIRAAGDEVTLEALVYKSWQQNKRLARSVQHRGPGDFIKRLKDRFEQSGGCVVEINPYVARLSQTCPACFMVHKKKLSERIHRCPCGYEMQRDLVSALLAFCIDPETNTADETTAMEHAKGAIGSGLRAACSRILKDANEEGRQRLNSCFGPRSELERLVREGECTTGGDSHRPQSATGGKLPATP